MKKRLTLSIDEKILEKAKKKCAKENISLSLLVEKFSIQFIKENS